MVFYLLRSTDTSGALFEAAGISVCAPCVCVCVCVCVCACVCVLLLLCVSERERENGVTKERAR